jgi:hypothetical protein
MIYMVEASRYILPQKKPDNLGLKLAGALFGLTVAMSIVMVIRDTWVFNHMTTAQHLWEAKRASETDGIDLALRHIGAITPNSSEASDAQILRTALRERDAVIKAAQAEKELAVKAARNARAAASATAIRQLSSELKNVGYDLSVGTSSNSPEEIVITSPDFDDTDHRVRFLAFVRGRSTPFAVGCWSGFTKVRLRSSKMPLVGFNESYSLGCY